ncbi:MAG TPA: DUF362 domain-containing protein [Polyangiaceae bacterium]|nr:DUF362 domain-containing protein [Polyangiaceae bacterium]
MSSEQTPDEVEELEQERDEDDEPESEDEPLHPDEEEIEDRSRRRLIKQAGIIAGASLVAGYAALAPETWPLSIADRTGERGKPKAEALSLPENGFMVEPSKTLPVLGVARGEKIYEMVKAAVGAIGGMSRFVSKGDVVVVKPNVAFERAAALGATTSPDVLYALIQVIREAGAKEVRVVDNPIEAPESCFERSGIRDAAVRAGARVYLPTPNDFRVLHTPGATLIEKWPFFWRPFIGADKVVGVSPVKDHNLCRASMTTKNWYGLLGGRRNQFHQDIHGIIADLALMMRPTLVILDGVRVLHRSGPTGGSLSDVREGRTLVASTDSLAADAFGWDDLLQRQGEALPAYFEKSARRHLGNPKWKEVTMKEVQIG